MLSYAFQILKEQGYKSLETEEFHNMGELCAAILCKGISLQLKRGLGKEYIPATDTLPGIRGKIELADSIKRNSFQKQQLTCSFEEFTENSRMNQILKTTMHVLMSSEISKPRKKELRKLLVFFSGIDKLDVHSINWHFQYNRNNQNYRMLMGICYLVLKGLLQTNTEGRNKLMDFLDEQRMSRLYEKFILEYYRKEAPLIKAQASQIAWQLDDDFSEMLPIMQTDIMLSEGEKILIIDAKYYTSTTQGQYDTQTLHSANLYQIFTYVKNKEAELRESPHEVSGMLLYAKTDNDSNLDKTYLMSGNRISVRTLDLNRDFLSIRKQLDTIADECFSSVNPRKDSD
jgi:5-methylcytosine-specific restriction enzyme subunit McrC